MYPCQLLYPKKIEEFKHLKPIEPQNTLYPALPCLSNSQKLSQTNNIPQLNEEQTKQIQRNLDHFNSMVEQLTSHF